jgi:hypothetical protein
MKNVSTGFGLCVLGLGIAAWPIFDRLVPQANAVGVGSVAPVVAAAALAQNPLVPTIVWMDSAYSESYEVTILQRMWSDGRLEMRSVVTDVFYDGVCYSLRQPSCSTQWFEVPAPPGGNGFACRTDLNGDRAVDGVDLGLILASWGQFETCNPEPEYPCVTLGSGWIKPPLP